MSDYIGDKLITDYYIEGVDKAYIGDLLLFDNSGSSGTDTGGGDGTVETVPTYDTLSLATYSISITSDEKDDIISWQIRDGKSGGSARTYGDEDGDGGWTTDLNELMSSSSDGGSTDSNNIPSRGWNGTEDISKYYANHDTLGSNMIPQGSTDDSATTGFTMMLAHYWQSHTTDITCKEAVQAGIDFIIRNQQLFNGDTCGGWGEIYPEEDNTSYLYHNEVTFNDSVHRNCMEILYRVANQIAPFNGDITDSTTRAAAQSAHELAEETIYVLQNSNSSGVKAIWSGKYDRTTMEPINARGWEKKDNMTRESGRLIKYLMSITQSDKMKVCIHYGIEFFKRTQIADTVYDQYTSPYLFTSVGDQVWPRFITRDTEEPIFYSSSGTAYDEITDLDPSWVSSYWFTTEGESLITREPI